MDPVEDRKHIVIHQENGQAVTRIVPLNFFGKLKDEYEKRNQDYITEEAQTPDRAEKYVTAAKVQEEEQEPGDAKASFEVEQVPCSTNPLKYDESKCIGCNRCANVCQCDILLHHRKKENIRSLCIRVSAITAVPASWSARKVQSSWHIR